MKVSARNKKK